MSPRARAVGASPPAEIEFIQYHEPALEAGDYEVTVTQSVSSTTGQIPSETFPATARYLSVAGPRFSLSPAEIVAVFPPPESDGDWSLVLPHVVLSRSTLPWERSPGASDAAAPWLALLVFEEDELPASSIVPAGELIGTLVPAETGDEPDEKVVVVDVPAGLLGATLPSLAEVSLLAHVRAGVDSAGSPTPERAVVVANRLPASGGRATALLVSLEARYAGSTFDPGKGVLPGGAVRLVVLKSWSFSCPPAGPDFRHILQGLDGGPLVAPAVSSAPEDPRVTELRCAGFVPLPHSIRPDLYGGGSGVLRESRTYSWYHGPLRPGDGGAAAAALLPLLPALCADSLLLYDADAGMFDASYAAAWELGRVLGLASRAYSVELYRYRCAYSRFLAAAAQTSHPHLPPPRVESPEPPLPPSVSGWLAETALLAGVPFDYLVPYDAMLPVESIRFFRLDPAWVNGLLDGALSLARLRPAGSSLGGAQLPPTLTSWNMTATDVVTGFLLRSEAVSGWPDLQADAFGAYTIQSGPGGAPEIVGTAPLVSLRAERLAPGVLLCLFQGQVALVEIHQKPEMLHFGFDAGADGPFKELRDPGNGSTLPTRLSSIPMRGTSRVVDVGALASKLASALELPAAGFTSAQLALQMIVGVEKVQFFVG